MRTRLRLKRCTLTPLVAGLILVVVIVVHETLVKAQGRGAANRSSRDSVCYAFLLQGDVWMTCGAQLHQVTKYDDVENFAISPPSGMLALVRHRPEPQGKVRLPSGNTVVSYEALALISPKSIRMSRLLPLAAPTELFASCGTLISETWDTSISVGGPVALVKDELDGKRLSVPGYKNFRCSSDRKVVAGWADPATRTLLSGLPPKRKLVGPNPHDSMFYDVSPNGRYIAYSTDAGLCVVEGNGHPACIFPGAYADRISVSDAGSVLFVKATGRPCYYKDMWHASVTPRPGYNGGDQCIGVADWSPGNKSPRMMKLLARDPQWITPEAASSLIEMSTQLSNTRR